LVSRVVTAGRGKTITAVCYFISSGLDFSLWQDETWAISWCANRNLAFDFRIRVYLFWFVSEVAETFSCDSKPAEDDPVLLILDNTSPTAHYLLFCSKVDILYASFHATTCQSHASATWWGLVRSSGDSLCKTGRHVYGL